MLLLYWDSYKNASLCLVRVCVCVCARARALMFVHPLIKSY
jgi:hypothetical protein